MSALAATALGAGGGPGRDSFPRCAGDRARPSACTSLGGQFAGVSDGWWCTDPAAASVDSVNEPVLVAACDGDYWATVLDDGIGSISFRCTYLSD